MSETAPDEPEDAAIDEDLYCLRCTYNLRGLSGDPVRCPECGTHNELADLRMSAEVLLKHLRALETLPTVCVAAMWSVAAGAALAAPGRMPCGFVLLVPAPCVWVWAIYRFASVCSFKPGWGAVLAWYHLAGAIPLLFVLAFGVVCFSVPTRFAEGWRGALLFGTLLFGAAAFNIVSRPRRSDGTEWSIYAIAKGKLYVFCRDIAIMQVKSLRKDRSSRT